MESKELAIAENDIAVPTIQPPEITEEAATTPVIAVEEAKASGESGAAALEVEVKIFQIYV